MEFLRFGQLLGMWRGASERGEGCRLWKFGTNILNSWLPTDVCYRRLKLEIKFHPLVWLELSTETGQASLRCLCHLLNLLVPIYTNYHMKRKYMTDSDTGIILNIYISKGRSWQKLFTTCFWDSEIQKFLQFWLDWTVVKL